MTNSELILIMEKNVADLFDLARELFPAEPGKRVDYVRQHTVASKGGINRIINQKEETV